MTKCFQALARAALSAFMLAAAGGLIGTTGAQLAPLPVDTIHATTPRAKSMRFIVAPYGWMTGISAETGVGDLAADVDLSFSDILSRLRFAAMGTFEGAYGPWLGIYGAAYVSVRVNRTLSRGRVQPELDLTMKLLATQGFTAYTVKPSPSIDVDLMAGSRLWAVRATLGVSRDTTQRTRERSPTWADALLGGRVRWRVDPRWQINLAGDGGAGGSKATGEGMATASYSVSRYWSLFLSYRYLYENYHKGEYFFTGHVAGPVIGGAYTW